MGFKDLKRAVFSEPVLKLPDFEKPFFLVHTVLMLQTMPLGILVQDKHPIAFESRKLK